MPKRSDEGKTELSGVAPGRLLGQARANEPPKWSSTADTAEGLEGIDGTDPAAPMPSAPPQDTAPSLAPVPERFTDVDTEPGKRKLPANLKASDATRVVAAASIDVSGRVTAPHPATPGLNPKRLQSIIAVLGGVVVGLVFLVVLTRSSAPPSTPAPAHKPPVAAKGVSPVAAPAPTPVAPATVDVAPAKAAADPNLGTVRIVCDPEAQVTIDGQSYGTTPVAVTRAPGPFTVTLENAARKFRVVTTLRAEAGKDNVSYLQYSPGWIDPQGAEGTKFFIDGKPVTSRPVQLWSGTHRVDAVFANGKKQSQQVEVQANLTSTVDFEFNPAE